MPALFSTLAKWVVVIGSLLTGAAITATQIAVDQTAIRFWDNAHWTCSTATGALLAMIGLRRSPADQRPIMGWFAAGLVGYFIGQLLWDLQVLTGWNPFPAPADLFYLSLAPLIAVGLLTTLRGHLSSGECWAAAFDILGLGTVVLALTLSLYLPRLGDTDTLTSVALVAYPVFLLTTTGIAGVVILILRLRLGLRTVTLLSGLLIHGLLWMEWNSRTIDGTLRDGALLNLLFAPGAILLSVGAYLWRPQRSSNPLYDRWCFALLRLLPLLLVVAASVAVVVAVRLPAITSVINICALAVVVFAMARQSLLLRERDRLLDTQRDLRASEDRFRQLVERLSEVFCLTDETSSRMLYCSPAFARLWGRPVAALMHDAAIWMDGIHPEDRERLRLNSRCALSSWETVYRVVRPDGGLRWVRDRRFRVAVGDDRRIAGIVEDVTDSTRASQREKALQAQLLQAQKLEAVGTLAGGIAHDFNNILTAVFGHAQLLQRRLEGDPRHAGSLAGILGGCERASELVRGILAFSRQQVAAVRPVQVEAIVAEAIHLLRPSLPTAITVIANLERSLPAVLADPVQIHQVVVNLTNNAVHAMAGSGTLTFTVDVPTGDRKQVRLKVSDSGCGMDETIKVRIFEPFFTTKAIGQGTGLGLAVVHGIVTALHGTIDVESTVGKGSSFTLLLPAAASADLQASPHHQEASQGAGEELLVVDDESAIRDMLRELLSSLGYRCTTVDSPAAALALVEAAPSRFAAVITDMNMPEGTGETLTVRLHSIRADLPVILSSGTELDAGEAAIAGVLAKPYTIATLSRVLADVLAKGHG